MTTAEQRDEKPGHGRVLADHGLGHFVAYGDQPAPRIRLGSGLVEIDLAHRGAFLS